MRPPSGRFRGRPSRGCRPSPRHRRRRRPWIRCPACRCPPIPSMPGWRHRARRRSCPPPLRCSWRFVPRAGRRARSYVPNPRRRRYPRCCLFRAGHGSSNPSRPSRRRPTGCRCVPIPRRPARGRPPCPGGRLSHYYRSCPTQYWCCPCPVGQNHSPPSRRACPPWCRWLWRTCDGLRPRSRWRGSRGSSCRARTGRSPGLPSPSPCSRRLARRCHPPRSRTRVGGCSPSTSRTRR